jgi:uncharacterized membrane protein
VVLLSGGQRALRALTAVLSLVGLGISIYLTVEHYTGNASLACSDTGTVNCLKVTTSPQSAFLGLPVALWGLLFYAGMTVLNSPLGYRWRRLHPLRLASVVGGLGFVLYLVYTELFTIDAICLWCTAVHVITVLLLLVVLLVDPASPRARSGGREPAPSAMPGS